MEDGSHSETLPFEKVEIHVEGEGEDKGTGEIPDDISLDNLKALINSGINIPALYVGTWWLRTPEQTDLFTTELFYYCQKKGINLRDYLFDELPLLLAAINLGGGIYNDYREFKKAEKEEKEEEEKDEGKKE